MKKSVVFIIAAALLVFAALPVCVFSEGYGGAPVPADSFTIWDGGYDTEWYYSGGHTGYSDDPYVIADARDLAGLSELVAGGVSFKGRYIVLSDDLYLNVLPASSDSDDLAVWAAYANKRTWKPIGDSSHAFDGSFNGQGHTIFGLYTEGYSHAGLFGCTDNAALSDLTISHSYISSSFYAGSFIAYMSVLNGTSTVFNCTSYAYIAASGGAVYAGGIVGYADAYRGNIGFENCRNRGEISFSSQYTQNIGVGGVIGYARSLHNYGYGAYFRIDGCENTGRITNNAQLHKNISTGGIVGKAEARNTKVSLTSCRNSGEIYGKGYTGGVVGHLSATVSSSSEAYVYGCSNSAAVSGDGYTGGLVGAMYSSISTAVPTDPIVYAERSYNSGVVLGNGTTGGLVGAMLSYGSNMALADCFETGRVWSEFSGSIELDMAIFDDSEMYGGAAALVGKIFAERERSSVISLARLYTSSDCTEKTAGSPSGTVMGICSGDGMLSLSVSPVLFRKTGLSAIGSIVGNPSSYLSFRGVNAEDLMLEETFFGFDFADTWTFDTPEIISSPVLKDVVYEKTICSHNNSSWNVTVPATCTEDGKRVFSCELCGELLAVETIPATGHTLGEWTVKRAAACTEAGERVRYCLVCFDEIEKEAIPATGHSPDDWTTVIAPTCTDGGLDAIICKTCHTILDSRKAEPLGHDFVIETVKEATYSETGLIVKTCQRCGEKEEIVVPVVICGHENTETRVEKEATCSEDGHQVTVCLLCGSILKEETVPKLPHENTEVVRVKEATCTVDGLEEVRCTKCGEVLETRIIPAAGHTTGEWETSVPATCLEGGEDRKYCTVCGETMIIRQTSALGHTQGEPVTVAEPTCTESGSGEYRCVRCGKLMSTFSIPASGHVPGEWVTTTEPTCTENGSKEQKCTACGETIAKRTIPAVGHTPTDERKEPTCTEDGFERTVCRVCGAVLSETSVPAIGHNMVEEKTESGTVRRCTVCGYTEDVSSGSETESTGPESTDADSAADGSSSGNAVNGTDAEESGESGISTTTVVVILICIITVFAAVCIVIILRSNKKSRLDE